MEERYYLSLLSRSSARQYHFGKLHHKSTKEASPSPGSLIDGEIRYKTSIDVGRQTQFCTHQTVGLRQRHHDGRIPAWDDVCHL